MTALEKLIKLASEDVEYCELAKDALVEYRTLMDTAMGLRAYEKQCDRIFACPPVNSVDK